MRRVVSAVRVRRPHWLYLKLISRSPTCTPTIRETPTQACSSPSPTTIIEPGTLAIGCGDVICQRLEGKGQMSALNHERTARMMITGCVCVTPLAYTIQRSVNRALPGTAHAMRVVRCAGGRDGDE